MHATCSRAAVASALANDVLDGFTLPSKELSPKYLFDRRGSELFSRMAVQPGSSSLRAELDILHGRAAEIVASTGAGELVELGSRASVEARVLLDAMRDAGVMARYLAFDASATVIEQAAETLAADYPGLWVQGIVGDFESDLGQVPPPNVPRLVALLAGAIGNVRAGTRRRRLAELAGLLGPDDHLLLGVALVADRTLIEPAYNDAAGVSAEFHRNLLHTINLELGGDLPVDNFVHVAFYDERYEWIDFRLRALQPCSAWLEALQLHVEFAAGEDLRTGISARFTPARLTADLHAAGLEPVALFADARRTHALSLARRAR